ncbi:maleylacetoacetate isomerase [Paraburkholderia aspalathi]|uniref:maleylacetoacetate isomerase n=1 Tax=Paraburkholderia nemoris TaxID=2793076 RepID=UPI00190CDEA8|nr:maleylacetoacetate isomerase [Paraburkholderia aspalathi]MBK3787180.1 maleylacetoacetate isomerase [Paraburkholderia aspalathi]
MTLHNYFNSSTSYRVRIAMKLKGVDYESIPVNLRKDENCTPEYLALNAAGGVPLLVGEEITLHQSIAIIDWLDHVVPEPRLIPEEPFQRARTLELSFAIASDIHPVNNLRILKYLTRTFNATDSQRAQWYQHWIHEGFVSVESLLRRYRQGSLCFGDVPTLAECCLVPQITNALRVGCDFSSFPISMEIFERCMTMRAFLESAPAAQPDYVP